MSDPKQAVCEKAVKRLKKVLTKVARGGNIASIGTAILEDRLDKRALEKLRFVRKTEKRLGSHTSDKIGSVQAAYEDCTTMTPPATPAAVLLASELGVCAWLAPNGIWVWHPDPKYRLAYWTKETKVFRPGARLKDGTWAVGEVPAG